MAADDDRGASERPDYKVYRSRRGLFSGRGQPGLEGLRSKKGVAGGGGAKPPRPPRTDRERGEPTGGAFDWRRWGKWALIAAAGWLLLSIVAFAVSAQIQKGKLADMGSTLHGNPFMLVSPQTILVLGTDVRSGAFAGADESESKNCLDAVTSGQPTDNNCKHGPYRSDTIMLIRAGRGTFRKLSIPR